MLVKLEHAGCPVCVVNSKLWVAWRASLNGFAVLGLETIQANAQVEKAIIQCTALSKGGDLRQQRQPTAASTNICSPNRRFPSCFTSSAVCNICCGPADQV
mmetsp:Transcript_38984/g.110421  ORF Transcript_38984/g.110421 Transcript_38984/m.110421 type:complete len:101 (+) Transcript_38984:838-1140(+)